MRRQRGFSLIELLAGLLILTLVITTALVAFTARKSRAQQAIEIISAYQALANEAEYRRRIPYRELKDADSRFMSATDVLDPLRPFETIVAVREIRPDVSEVMMTIRWRHGERQAKLMLVRADIGLAPRENLW